MRARPGEGSLRATTSVRRWLVAVWAAGALAVSLTLAQTAPPPAPWYHIGPLRIRDLTPFGILRMDFLPAHAVTATPRTWAFEVNLSYQNTYVLSPNVTEYLHAKGGGSRVQLDASDIPGILATGDEAYFVDGELGLFDLTAHYRFSRHWGGYVTIPFLVFQNGFLDGAIEGFHELFGLDDADRDLAARNDFFVVTEIEDGTVVVTEPPDDGFGDPVLGVRYSVVASPEKWNLILEAGVKPAFRHAKVYVSSGRTDYGLQASFQKFFRRHALFACASVVRFAGTDLAGISPKADYVPTGVLAWEMRLSRHINGIVQLYASPSVIRDTAIEELKENKYIASLGIQAQAHTWFYRFALTENLVNFRNTADIALTLSVAKVFPAKP